MLAPIHNGRMNGCVIGYLILQCSLANVITRWWRTFATSRKSCDIGFKVYSRSRDSGMHCYHACGFKYFSKNEYFSLHTSVLWKYYKSL